MKNAHILRRCNTIFKVEICGNYEHFRKKIGHFGRSGQDINPSFSYYYRTCSGERSTSEKLSCVIKVYYNNLVYSKFEHNGMN